MIMKTSKKNLVVSAVSTKVFVGPGWHFSR